VQAYEGKAEFEKADDADCTSFTKGNEGNEAEIDSPRCKRDKRAV